MASTAVVSSNTSSDIRRYLSASVIAAALATAINVAIYFLGRAVFNLPLAVPMQNGGEPTTLPVFMVVMLSAVPAFLAAAVLYGLNRFTRRGLIVFQILSAVLAVLSLGGPLSLPIDGGTKVALSAMHLVAAAAIVGVLSSRAPHGRQV